MDNFIEDSVNYLFYNGGFDFLTGMQKFKFRVRSNDEIEVTSINNHVTKVYKGDKSVYEFFAFIVFCDMFSSHQKSNITLCKDKDVSKNNLKVLNKVYAMYKVMLSLDNKTLSEAISSPEPDELFNVLLESLQESYPFDVMNLSYNVIKSRLDSYAFDFTKRVEFLDNLYQELITSEEYDLINEYAMIRWEEAQNNIEAKHSDFFTKDKALETLFSRTNKLESDLEISISGGEELKHSILNILIDLYDMKVDILEIVFIIKCAFSSACMDDRECVLLDDFIDAVDLSYLTDVVKDSIISKLDSLRNKKSKGKIITLYKK